MTLAVITIGSVNRLQGGIDMTLGRWDSFRNVVTLQDRINRMFEETFPHPSGADEEMCACAWKPEVDIFETDAGLCIRADLPGLRKEEVSVEFRDTILVLRGERQADDAIDDDHYLRRERCCGTFQRAFNIRHHVSPDQIKATFKDGVLQIDIPRPEKEQPRQIRVNIE
jgi:HSP20 family protein